MSNKFKVDVVRDGKFKDGECRVVGSYPKSLPYVWIGDQERGCLAVLDARQMNMLAKRWAQANKARTRRGAGVGKNRTGKAAPRG